MKSYILFLAIFLVMGCAKDGPIGPEGEKGEQGVPGLDGNRILSGSTNPNNTLGKNGDFYLNLTTGDLFGPKTQTGWGNPYTMKGPKGDKGNTGSIIIMGKATPSGQIGKEGDYYIESTNLLLYGPKTNIGWGVPISLDKIKESKGVTVYILPADFSNNYSIAPDSSFTGKTKEYLLPNAKNKIIEIYWHTDPPFGIPDPIISQLWSPLISGKEIGAVGYGPFDLMLYKVNFGTNVKSVNTDISVSFSIKGKGFSRKPDFSGRGNDLYFIVKVTEVDNGQVLSREKSNRNGANEIPNVSVN
ncbi:hypothetical protein [Sphingobacterium sp.]|uniref:hypothetical protein n=1 Tax=Sphingobacterium sp. TaxID=341027 RepID=UPI002582AA07|nr:hypothetical protein [Sphingobacterium sp.]WET70853.1 MAG: hypothetical protein P0Y57_07145 [Sphingobacterium sp.]